VTLLNALAKPVTLPCFLETLPRPLELHAALSVFSAQPASGVRSPRLFLFLDPLIMSVVPDGVGRALLELGELQSETRSVKAEVEFPVRTELSQQDPFDHVLFNELATSCSLCHQQEERVRIGGAEAFASQALRPTAEQRVGVAELRAELSACDAVAEPERCAMLEAIFGREVRDREFPAAMSTFF